ncbi:RICIN domain-containing protein [Streptomyces spongiae]|uniref:Ricin B lectin domain-containing protein n=1 Tax=Streptomyces spongiae TaxID=565072 RepID=A0A5N8XYP6_9ACTN|nr:RICIN domain-containing protein [Streptomyces spongiae]MPY64484.1 hypothetical protein [Streptomyces spongiae]
MGAQRNTGDGATPATTGGLPHVRVAVALPGGSEPPEGALTPGGPAVPGRSANSVAQEAGEREEQARTAAAPVPKTGRKVGEAGEAGRTDGGAVSAAARSEKAKEVEKAGEAKQVEQAEEAEEAMSSAVAMGNEGSPPGAAEAASPRRGPKKPMLAAAAIVGAVLIAVPFLLMGGGNDEDKRRNVSREASDTVLDAGAASGDAGDYSTEPPSASPSEKPSKKPRQEKGATAPSSSAAPKSTASGPATGAGKSKSKAQSKTKSRTGGTSGARSAANAASSSGKVLIKNATTAMCADVPYFGAGKDADHVNQYFCDNTSADNQLWNLQVRSQGGGPGGAHLFRITNNKGGLCMDLPDYGAKPAGTNVSLAHCNATAHDNQLWWLDPRADGTYWIRNFASGGLCLDVSGFATGGSAARLTIYHCNDSTKADDHHWSLV